MLVFLDKMYTWIGLLPFIAVPFFIMGQFRYVRDQRKWDNGQISEVPKYPLKSIVVFAVLILSMFFIADLFKREAILRTKDFFEKLTPNVAVLIDGKPSLNSKEIIYELSKVRGSQAHHSHPTSTLHVLLQDHDESFMLWLGRDSQNPKEYWVFYPDFKATTMNEIGRITTGVFDQF